MGSDVWYLSRFSGPVNFEIAKVDCSFQNHLDDYFYSTLRYLCAPELRRAMKALGFRVSRDEAKQLTVDGSLKGKGLV